MLQEEEYMATGLCPRRGNHQRAEASVGVPNDAQASWKLVLPARFSATNCLLQTSLLLQAKKTNILFVLNYFWDRVVTPMCSKTKNTNIYRHEINILTFLRLSVSCEYSAMKIIYWKIYNTAYYVLLDERTTCKKWYVYEDVKIIKVLLPQYFT